MRGMRDSDPDAPVAMNTPAGIVVAERSESVKRGRPRAVLLED
jgi:hypothetical protein